MGQKEFNRLAWDNVVRFEMGAAIAVALVALGNAAVARQMTTTAAELLTTDNGRIAAATISPDGGVILTIQVNSGAYLCQLGKLTTNGEPVRTQVCSKVE